MGGPGLPELECSQACGRCRLHRITGHRPLLAAHIPPPPPQLPKLLRPLLGGAAALPQTADLAQPGILNRPAPLPQLGGPFWAEPLHDPQWVAGLLAQVRRDKDM